MGDMDQDRVQRIVRDAMHADVSLELDAATLLAEVALEHEVEAPDAAALFRILFAEHPGLGASAANYVAVAVKGWE